MIRWYAFLGGIGLIGTNCWPVCTMETIGQSIFSNGIKVSAILPTYTSTFCFYLSWVYGHQIFTPIIGHYVVTELFVGIEFLVAPAYISKEVSVSMDFLFSFVENKWCHCTKDIETTNLCQRKCWQAISCCCCLCRWLLLCPCRPHFTDRFVFSRCMSVGTSRFPCTVEFCEILTGKPRGMTNIQYVFPLAL